MLDGQSRQDLQAMARSRQGPRDLAQRAKIIFLAAEGLSNIAIAQQLGLSKLTVGKWRRRFLSQGLTGLYEDFRPGRPRSISDEQVAARFGRKTSRMASMAISAMWSRMQIPIRWL